MVCEGKILPYNMGIVFMKSRLKIPSHPRKFRLTLGNSVSPSEIPSHPRRFRLTLGDSVSPSEIPSHPRSFSNIPKLPNFTKNNISRINIVTFVLYFFRSASMCLLHTYNNNVRSNVLLHLNLVRPKIC